MNMMQVGRETCVQTDSPCASPEASAFSRDSAKPVSSSRVGFHLHIRQETPDMVIVHVAIEGAPLTLDEEKHMKV
jgi:hypothetical protein